MGEHSLCWPSNHGYTKWGNLWLSMADTKVYAGKDEVETLKAAAWEAVYALGNIYSYGVNHPLSFKQYEDAIQAAQKLRKILETPDAR